MKRNNFKNLSEAVKEEEFKEKAEQLSGEADTFEETEEPITDNYELKVRKSRRTKIAVASFIFLLGVGLLGNWYYENSDFSSSVRPLVTSSQSKTLGEAEYVNGTTEAPKNESSYFSQARLERESTRDEAIELLQGIVENAQESEQSKKSATDRLALIAKYAAIENKIESLVSAKGVNNCLAVINENGDRVDVIVDTQELSDSLIMQIKEIAMAQLGCEFEAVSIIQSESKN
jgi:stage III sporulation protein AH